jgi:hypothetical protein
MDLKDATLMFLTESADEPAVERIAQAAYDRLVESDTVDHRVLSELLGEASAKGVLRTIHRKYSPVAYDAMLMPICREIDRQRPVPPRTRPAGSEAPFDPLTAPISDVMSAQQRL